MKFSRTRRYEIVQLFSNIYRIKLKFRWKNRTYERHAFRARQEIRNSLLFSLSRITSGFLLIRSTILILPLLYFLLDYFAYFIPIEFISTMNHQSRLMRNNSMDNCNFIICNKKNWYVHLILSLHLPKLPNTFSYFFFFLIPIIIISNYYWKFEDGY